MWIRANGPLGSFIPLHNGIEEVVDGVIESFFLGYSKTAPAACSVEILFPPSNRRNCMPGQFQRDRAESQTIKMTTFSFLHHANAA